MNFIYSFFKGILIGAGAILPGISSGVLCVVFGLYEKLIDSILGFFKNIKENFKFLFPIFFGALVGVIIFGNVLKYLFFAYPMQIKYIFIGLILGTIPQLIKKTNNMYIFKPYYLLFTFISLGFGLFLVFLENNINSSSASESSFLFLIISGFVMSAGVIIPGVSSTLILMLLNIYPKYLSAVSTLNISFLLPLGIGLIFGSLFFMKLTKFLMNRYYPQTFYTIIGFTIGSVFVLYSGFSFNINGIIAILSFVLGIIISTIITPNES